MATKTKKKAETYTCTIQRYETIMRCADQRISLTDKRSRPTDITTDVVIDSEAGTVTMPINVARGLNLIEGKR